jgi:urea transport system permease protein
MACRVTGGLPRRVSVSLEIFWMQLFSGVSYTAILLLMSLGLAIVFGLMGVINMAHGELMALGAYVTFMVANVFLTVFPDSVDTYILFAIPIAFLVTFLFGMFLEWSVVRWFYNRPLDTLLATWGLSLILQQTYRTVFGPQEVTIPLASWLDGAIEPFTGVQLPLNRIFIVVLTLLVAAAVYLLFFKTRMGLKVRAITQNRAIAETVGINTRQVDMYTFALGSGLAGIAGSVFTMIGSTNPGTGQLYIVDTFIVVVFGGVASIMGTALSSFIIAQ